MTRAFALIALPRRAQSASAADSSKRLPPHNIIVGCAEDGELLVFSETVLDSAADPQVQMPQLKRESRGVYTGTRNARVAPPGAPPNAPRYSTQIPLTPEEIATGLEIAKELWRRRCAGPRAET